MMILRTFFKDQKGTTAIEYALICAFIGLAVVGVSSSMGSNTTISLKKVTDVFQTASEKQNTTVDKIVTGHIDKDNSQ